MKEPVWSPDSRRIVYYHDAGMACVDGDTVIDLGRCKELDFENIPDRGPWTWHPESNGGAFLDDAGRVVRLDPDCKRVVWRSEPHADAQVVAWPFGNIVLLCKRGLKTLDPLTGKLRKQVHW